MFDPDKLAAGEALTQISLTDRKIPRGARLSRDLILSWKNAQQMHNLGVFKIYEKDPEVAALKPLPSQEPAPTLPKQQQKHQQRR
jgi:hypothetical protein